MLQFVSSRSSWFLAFLREYAVNLHFNLSYELCIQWSTFVFYSHLVSSPLSGFGFFVFQLKYEYAFFWDFFDTVIYFGLHCVWRHTQHYEYPTYSILASKFVLELFVNQLIWNFVLVFLSTAYCHFIRKVDFFVYLIAEL